MRNIDVPQPRSARYYKCLAAIIDIIMICTFLAPLIFGIWRLENGSDDFNDMVCVIFGFMFMIPTILICFHSWKSTRIANIMNILFIVYLACVAIIVTKDPYYLILIIICSTCTMIINLPQSTHLNSR